VVSKVEGIDPRELQSLQIYLNEYRQQAEIFTQQLALLEEGRVEALAAIDAIQGIKSSPDDTVLLQLGGGVSLRVRMVEPERVLLNVGADVVVERSSEEAVEYLKDRLTEMEASAKKVVETLDQLKYQMNEIARRLETGYHQYQMQQARPVPGEDQE
jgi:prefoldin alpha subunit